MQPVYRLPSIKLADGRVVALIASMGADEGAPVNRTGTTFRQVDFRSYSSNAGMTSARRREASFRDLPRKHQQA